MSKCSFLRSLVLFVSIPLIVILPGVAAAKSMYVIADINSSPTPVRTYDIQSAPTYLAFQATANVPSLAGGAVGLGLDDSSGKLFITYEVSNTIQLVDATTFAVLGTTTAPSASNLAGIVVDQGNNKVYTVDRETNHLFVYSWNSATDTLTLDGGTFKTLAGVSRANGIALDETRGRLYIGDRDSTTVRYFDTTSWIEAGNVDLSSEGQTVMGVAIDSVRNILYTGNAYGPYGSLGKLVKHNLNTSTTTAYTLPGAAGGDNIVGVAVDEDTGYVYVTTGNQGSGGTDTIIVFDSSLAVLKNDIGDIGNPTGIAIPKAQVSYNPLNFTKTEDADPVASGADLTYSLCYDNASNPSTVNNVIITDDIPTGTTFVSATGTYGIVGNSITWTIGTLAANAPSSCVSLTVNVTASDGAIIQNSATIDSDETPPTTQVENTSVGSGTSPGIIFAGKGEGGTASTGPLELILGIVALPWLLARRKVIPAQQTMLFMLIGIMLSMAIATSVFAADTGKYIGVGAGIARTDYDDNRYDSDLAGLGYTTSSSIDNDRATWKIFGGYAIDKRWGLEATYVNLGDVTSSTLVSAPPLPTAVEQQQFVDAAATVHPYSVDGIALAGKGTWDIGSKSNVFAKLGIFLWRADILVRCVGCATSVSAPETESGVDWTFGLGFNYDINNDYSIRAEYERYGTDRNDINAVTASLVYRF